jgi:hypothetical protein
MKIDAVKLKQNAPRAGAGLMLWIGLVLPPMAWAIQLQALWLTSEWACAKSDFKWNHIVAVIALSIAVSGALIAWTQARATAETPKETTIERPQTRDFMSVLGTVLGIFFTIVIFAQWLPTLTGVPCSK